MIAHRLLLAQQALREVEPGHDKRCDAKHHEEHRQCHCSPRNPDFDLVEPDVTILILVTLKAPLIVVSAQSRGIERARTHCVHTAQRVQIVLGGEGLLPTFDVS